jgi:hypothetical protein
MTNKPYNITPEHFARARADIDRRRADIVRLSADLDAEFALLDAGESAIAIIAERYPQEAITPKSGTSYAVAVDPHGLGTVTVPPPPAKVRKARRPNSGRPYKPEENERIAAAHLGQLKQLAEELGRGYDGVLKQHELLLKRGKHGFDMPAPDPAPEMEEGEETKALVGLIEREALTGQRAVGDVGNLPPGPLSPTHPEQPDTPAPDPAGTPRLNYNTPFQDPWLATENQDDPIDGISASPPPDEELGSENTAIVEPTAAPKAPPRYLDAARSVSLRELAEADAQRQRRPPVKPGRAVDGIVDNGPGHGRLLDPDAFASSNSG